MLSAILFIIITSTAYASPVHIEPRDIASLDDPVITVRCCHYCRTLNKGLYHFQRRLVRRVWPFSQDSLESNQYELPLGLPTEMNFRDLDRSWKNIALAKDADSELSQAYLKEFDTEIAELTKPNAVLKRIEISGARTSNRFKVRWYDIVKELGLLQKLYGDRFKWGHSKNLDIVYIVIRVGRNKKIDVPKVSLPEQRMALPEVKKFILDHRLTNDDL